MAFDIRSKNIPQYLKIIITVVPALLIVILFIFLIYSPKSKEIKVLNARIAKLDNEIASAEVKIRKLPELRAENEKLKIQLAELQEQLPEEKEVSVLLKQISDLGLQSGLVILLWKPEARAPDPKGVYVEIPVKMEIVGGYHDLGVFFSHISRLKRIVNISKIKIDSHKKAEEAHLIQSVFTASTFSAVERSEGAPAPQQGKKRGR